MSTIRLTKDDDGKKWFLAWVSPDLQIRFLSPSDIEALQEL